MKTIRSLSAVLLLSFCCAFTPAYGNSFSTDQSDLWWNASESGWGMQLVQRGSIIFATIFVYDTFGIPIWYSATLQSVGALNWQGDLYLTNGPWFGTVPFNPNAVGIRKVGTMTWNGQFVESGIVNYSVDGVAVTKNVVRQFLTLDNYAGTYLGAGHETDTGCFSAANNGVYENFATFTISQSGQAVVVVESFSNGTSCTFPGTLTQGGQFGKIVGNYSCTSGDAGTFNFFEGNVGFNTLSGRYTTSSTATGCQATGYLGGTRHR